MLKTINLINNYNEQIILKKINYINIFINNFKLIHYKNHLNFNKFNLFFINTFIYYFLKLIWRGKAYRIRFFKKSNKFTFNFGHSHWYKLKYNRNIYSIFKLKRQLYIIIFKNRKLKNILINNFNNIRVYNKYTKRGLRVKNTPYIKRFGKISQIN